MNALEIKSLDDQIKNMDEKQFEGFLDFLENQKGLNGLENFLDNTKSNRQLVGSIKEALKNKTSRKSRRLFARLNETQFKPKYSKGTEVSKFKFTSNNKYHYLNQ